ncbi:hypothetical protein A0J61_09176, partial [Choanephora cucurbitarum]
EHSFNPETVSKVFKTAFKNESSKVNKEALQLCAEFFLTYLFYMYIEAVHRSSDEQDVMSESTGSLEVEHLERTVFPFYIYELRLLLFDPALPDVLLRLDARCTGPAKSRACETKCPGKGGGGGKG